MANAYLEPVAAGQTRFRMQGLTPDARGIAVGREALIEFDSIDRLVAMLGAYSEEASLDDLVPSLTIELGRREGGGQALLMRLAAADGYALDRLSRLAGATHGRLYTGSGSVYVKTRERAAPFGYDLAVPVSELGPPGPDGVLAVDTDVAARYTLSERIDPVELIQQLELRPVPLPAGGIAGDVEACGVREMALLLVAPGLGDRMLSYLWRQEVAMAGVRVHLDDDKRPSLLLRIRQPRGRLLDVLRQIPGVEILAPISPRAAVEVGYHHPIHLASANSCLPGDEMYLFRGGARRVERIDGAPRFVDGRHLVRSEIAARLRDVGQLKPTATPPLEVELVLRASAGGREPRAALVPWSAAEQLRRLVYLIPPSTLAASMVVSLPEGLLVVAGAPGGGRGPGRAPIAGSLIPLGQRMVEVAPGVLVPDGHELWPRVRPGLVRSLLNLEGDDHAVFLGPDRQPVRVPADMMRPLDTAVIGRLELDDASTVQSELTALEPAKIENERLGRFALWAFRGGEG